MVQIDRKQLEFYVTGGYVLFRNVLPPGLLDAARRAVLNTIGSWVEAEGRNSNKDPAARDYSSRPHFIYNSDEGPVMALALCPEVKTIIKTFFTGDAEPDQARLANWYRCDGTPTPHIDTPPNAFDLMPYHMGT